MELLKKYFGEHYPDEPMFLRNLNKISPVHGQVQDLCNRYCITQNIDTLQKLYFVAKIVRLRSKHVTPKHEIKTQIEYKRELYSLFLYILKRRNNTSIDKPIFKTIVAKEYNRSHTLTDGLILSQFEDFIFDTVAELHTGKRWNQLNQNIEYEGNIFTNTFKIKNDEQGQIITEVEQWLNEYGEPQKGQPNKSYFTGLFLHSLKEFIQKETDNNFESERQLHSFMGELCVLIEILQPGNGNQLIKEIENKLRAVNT